LDDFFLPRFAMLLSAFSKATSGARTAVRALSTSSVAEYQGLIMGAPGSGKGTISKRMVKKFGMEVGDEPWPPLTPNEPW
jgi:hypothetical protein